MRARHAAPGFQKGQRMATARPVAPTQPHLARLRDERQHRLIEELRRQRGRRRRTRRRPRGRRPHRRTRHRPPPRRRRPHHRPPRPRRRLPPRRSPDRPPGPAVSRRDRRPDRLGHRRRPRHLRHRPLRPHPPPRGPLPRGAAAAVTRPYRQAATPSSSPQTRNHRSHTSTCHHSAPRSAAGGTARPGAQHRHRRPHRRPSLRRPDLRSSCAVGTNTIHWLSSLRSTPPTLPTPPAAWRAR